MLKSIYPKLPVAFQNIGISAFGLSWKSRRFGGVFAQQLKLFKDREAYSNDQWNGYVTEKLRKMLIHAYENVPYYRDMFSRYGLPASSLGKIDLLGLNKVPFLEKETLRNAGKSTLLSVSKERGGKFFASSGSTGTPTSILFSRPMHQRWSAAFEARIRHWAGVDRFTARGMIGGRRVVSEGNASPPFYRYNVFERQVYMSAYHISKDNAENYLDGIKKHRVEYMTGYAMSNFFLARFFDELGLDAPQLKAVITSSEKLTDKTREVFKKVYRCKAFDSWSGLEACGLISECESGNLHISPDIGIIEILDEYGKPCSPGVIGEIVCTGLLNFDQPLIRYKIGDLASWEDKPCLCGRSMPVIKEIVGRVEDVVIGKDGREMVRFHGIFLDLPNVIEGQIIQNDFDDFVINAVTNGNLSAEEESTLKKRMESQLGKIKLQINEVDSILRTANGKFRAVISHVRRKNRNRAR